MDKKVLAFMAVFAIVLSGAACLVTTDADGVVADGQVSDVAVNEEKTTTDDISWVAWIILALCVIEIAALAAYVYYRIGKN